jgi:hypothetical protein
MQLDINHHAKGSKKFGLRWTSIIMPRKSQKFWLYPCANAIRFERGFFAVHPALRACSTAGGSLDHQQKM